MGTHRDLRIDPTPEPETRLAPPAGDALPGELATGQRALRRVAELIAKGVPQRDLFAAVAIEASRLVKEDTTLLRVEGDGVYSVIAVCGGPAPVGTRLVVAADDEGLVAEIARTRRPARLDDCATRTWPVYARDDSGVRSSVGVPIIVDNRIWGILGATTDGRNLPAGTEHRLAQFAELMAAALANAQARADLQRLADEQTALRAVAELVAQAASTEDIFAAVTVEASRLLEDTPMTLTRFESERELVVLATTAAPRRSELRSRMNPARFPTASGETAKSSASTTTPASWTLNSPRGSTWPPRSRYPSR